MVTSNSGDHTVIKYHLARNNELTCWLFMHFLWVRWYSWLLWGSEGAPSVTDGRRDGTFDGFKKAVCLFTHQNNGIAKTGYLNGIFGHFGALRGST